MKLRSYLILLVIAAVLPVVIFAAVMTYLSYRQQRENLADRMIAGIAEDITARKDTEVRVQTQNKALQVLHDIGHDINSVDSPDTELRDVLARILQKLIAVGSFDLGSIRVEDVSDALPLILVHHGYHHPEQINRSTRIVNRGNPAQHPARYRVVETGKARAVDDVQSYDGLTMKEPASGYTYPGVWRLFSAATLRLRASMAKARRLHSRLRARIESPLTPSRGIPSGQRPVFSKTQGQAAPLLITCRE
jgi:hypothetical protein